MNPELIKAAEEAARAAAMQATFEKLAVIPAGGDPTAGGPAGMPGGAGAPPPGAPPGMDPAMGGMPPPGGDPAAMGAPTDPALAAAGGGISDQVRQLVQQELMNQGGGAAKGGVGGKSAKPDMAVELAKLNDLVYKLGMMLTAIGKEMNIEFPAATLLGPAPDTSDPALAQAANTTPAPSAGPAGADPNAAAGGAPQPPFPPIEPMSGNPEDQGQKAAQFAALSKAASGIASLAGLVEDEFDDELISGIHATKLGAIPPDAVGSLINLMPQSVTHAQPLSLAQKLRQKTRV